MKTLFLILFFLSFGNSFCQKNIVVIQRECYTSSCSEILKQQHTFNKKGVILEYIRFGKSRSLDTTGLAFVVKFKYKHSKRSEITEYASNRLFSHSKNSYKKGLLRAVEFDDDEIVKRSYDINGKIVSYIITKGSETVAGFNYSYNGKELSEIVSYNDKVLTQKRTYSKRHDTIVEINARYIDSIAIDKPDIEINKKKYNGSNLIYCSSFYEGDKLPNELFLDYDANGNIEKVEQVYVEKDTVKKEKCFFRYRNGLLNKIEEFEFVNTSWKHKKVIAYEIQKPYEGPTEKIKRRINLYLTKRYVSENSYSSIDDLTKINEQKEE